MTVTLIKGRKLVNGSEKIECDKLYNLPKRQEVLDKKQVLPASAIRNAGKPVRNIGTQGVQELFFWDLKAPGGSSTLKSYDKGNSFTNTGPGFQSMSLEMN